MTTIAGPSGGARTTRRKIQAIGRLASVVALVAGGLSCATVTATADDSVPATSSVITVKTGGSRTDPTTIGPLAGVQLAFYAIPDSGSVPDDATADYTCTSTADGDCKITVPDTDKTIAQGGNADQQFLIRQSAAPTGWYTNPVLGLHPVGSTGVRTPYGFTTPEKLEPGRVYSSQSDFMQSTWAKTGEGIPPYSGGVWQSSLNNPNLAKRCGLNVALVTDLSGSIGDQLPDLKTAAEGLVDSLTGTPSQIALYTFGTNAPATGDANRTMPLTPVSTTESADLVKSRIHNLQLEGATNWDRGLAQVSEAGDHVDAVIFLTDGFPQASGPNALPGQSYYTALDMERAIASANALKAAGTRVIAVGVGKDMQAPEAPLNMRAISGPDQDDYFQAANFEAAGTTLKELATGTCNGSVSVIKQVVPSDAPAGTTQDAAPAGGWIFTATENSDSLDLPQGTGTTNEIGAVNFPITFKGSTTGRLTLTETQSTGYSLQQVDGANAVCTRLDSGAPVAVTNAGDLGFTLDVSPAYPVTCTVYNRAPETTPPTPETTPPTPETTPPTPETTPPTPETQVTTPEATPPTPETTPPTPETQVTTPETQVTTASTSPTPHTVHSAPRVGLPFTGADGDNPLPAVALITLILGTGIALRLRWK